MRFGGIVVVVLLALGACSSDPEVREPPPSTSATPTATPPTMPAQARQDSPEGAAAFVKHYIDVFNFAARTGDVAELERLSSPTCEGCQSYIKLFRDTYKAGGYFKGGDWRISQVEVEKLETDSRVFAHLDAKEGTQKRSSNDQVGSTSTEDDDLIFIVSPKHRTHLISSLTRSQR